MLLFLNYNYHHYYYYYYLYITTIITIQTLLLFIHYYYYCNSCSDESTEHWNLRKERKKKKKEKMPNKLFKSDNWRWIMKEKSKTLERSLKWDLILAKLKASKIAGSMNAGVFQEERKLNEVKTNPMDCKNDKNDLTKQKQEN